MKETNSVREIDITKQDIRCCDDFYIEDGYINIPYELWFDVDKYFGTDTKDTNDWINFYTYYYPSDGSISAVYEIDYDNTDTESMNWELTETEKAFFKGMMLSYCLCKCGCTLDELYMQM